MIGFARPTVAEERWLAVAAALGANRTPAEVTARTGGWRSTGLLARIAMFFLGLLAAALIAGVLSLGGTTTLLIAGLVAAFAAESLARGKRLFASGIEEGLCLGGSSGINVAGAIRMARELGPGHTIVTILCDYGTRYQSKLFNPEFLRAKNLPVPAWLEHKSTFKIPFEKI